MHTGSREKTVEGKISWGRRKGVKKERFKRREAAVKKHLVAWQEFRVKSLDNEQPWRCSYDFNLENTVEQLTWKRTKHSGAIANNVAIPATDHKQPNIVRFFFQFINGKMEGNHSIGRVRVMEYRTRCVRVDRLKLKCKKISHEIFLGKLMKRKSTNSSSIFYFPDNNRFLFFLFL